MLKNIRNVATISIGFAMLILSGCKGTDAICLYSIDSPVPASPSSSQQPADGIVDESTAFFEVQNEYTNSVAGDYLTNAEATIAAASELATAEISLLGFLESNPEYIPVYNDYRGVIDSAIYELKLMYTDTATGVIGREWRFVSIAKEAEMIRDFIAKATDNMIEGIKYNK